MEDNKGQRVFDILREQYEDSSTDTKKAGESGRQEDVVDEDIW